jgi:hypothetical protein
MKKFNVIIKDANCKRCISVIAQSWHHAMEIVLPQLDVKTDSFVTVKPI